STEVEPKHNGVVLAFVRARSLPFRSVWISASALPQRRLVRGKAECAGQRPSRDDPQVGRAAMTIRIKRAKSNGRDCLRLRCDDCGAEQIVRVFAPPSACRSRSSYMTRDARPAPYKPGGN